MSKNKKIPHKSQANTLDRYFLQPQKKEKCLTMMTNVDLRPEGIENNGTETGEIKKKINKSISRTASFPARITTEVVGHTEDYESSIENIVQMVPDENDPIKNYPDEIDRDETEPNEIELNFPPVTEKFVQISTNSKCLCAVADFPDTFFSLNLKRKLGESDPTTSSTDSKCKKFKNDQENEVTEELTQHDEAKEQNLSKTPNSKIVQPEINEAPDPKMNQEKPTLQSNDAEPNEITVKVVPTQGIWTGNNVFENTIHELVYEDFNKIYSKLGCEIVPICPDPQFCKESHKNTTKQQVSPGQHASIFITLDTDVKRWNFDMIYTALSHLLPEQYFRGDVLRLLFDYLMHGPDNGQAIEVQYLLSCHFVTHPTCSAQLNSFYIELLSQPDPNGGGYFKTHLADEGVLYFVISEMEKHINSENQEEEPLGSNNLVGERISFDTMERRWNNFEPLLGKEQEKIIEVLDTLKDDCPEEEIKVLTTDERRDRLHIALELILDLLKADFMICVAKLKSWIIEGIADAPYQTPIIGRFMEVSFQNKIFRLYASTSNMNSWVQLNRIIGMMAELLHLFTPDRSTIWKYPDLNSECLEFSLRFFNAIRYCKWSELEKLERLRMIKPPWLRQQVTMSLVNAELKVQIGNDLMGIIDIVNLHIKTPAEVEFTEKNRLKIKTSSTGKYGKCIPISDCSSKKIEERNQHGEIYLHKICKLRKTNVSKIQSALASPDIDVNITDYFGWSTLHEAVAKGHLSNVKALLSYEPPSGKSGVNVTAQNVQGDTPLHVAVNIDSLQKCQILLQFGGTFLIAIPNKEGETPLSLAKKTNKQIYQYFMDTLKTQEFLNLTKEAKLNLDPHIIQMLDIACCAIFDDYKTLKLLYYLSHDRGVDVQKHDFIVVDMKCLVTYQTQVKMFSRLNKILNSLHTSPFIAQETSQWLSKLKV